MDVCLSNLFHESACYMFIAKALLLLDALDRLNLLNKTFIYIIGHGRGLGCGPACNKLIFTLLSYFSR